MNNLLKILDMNPSQVLPWAMLYNFHRWILLNFALDGAPKTTNRLFWQMLANNIDDFGIHKSIRTHFDVDRHLCAFLLLRFEIKMLRAIDSIDLF